MQGRNTGGRRCIMVEALREALRGVSSFVVHCVKQRCNSHTAVTSGSSSAALRTNTTHPRPGWICSSGIVWLKKPAGPPSLLFHVLRELSSSAQDKLHRRRALQRAACQMTPITLPPMMPRSPRRREKIHYTGQTARRWRDQRTTLHFRSFTT